MVVAFSSLQGGGRCNACSSLRSFKYWLRLATTSARLWPSTYAPFLRLIGRKPRCLSQRMAVRSEMDRGSSGGRFTVWWKLHCTTVMVFIFQLVEQCHGDLSCEGPWQVVIIPPSYQVGMSVCTITSSIGIYLDAHLVTSKVGVEWRTVLFLFRCYVLVEICYFKYTRASHDGQNMFSSSASITAAEKVMISVKTCFS